MLVPLPHRKESVYTARQGGRRQPGIGMHSLERRGKDGDMLPKFWWESVQSCSFFQEHETCGEAGAEQASCRELGLNTRQHRTPKGAVFWDCRAWCWGKNLFEEGKLPEVKHFCSKLLQRSSKNMSGSTPVISGAEHQVHRNSSERQVASFQHAECCSSTVSHPSFCILIDSHRHVFLQSTTICNLIGEKQKKELH